MASRENLGRFPAFSSSHSTNLPAPASSPTAQTHHDSSGSDFSSDGNRGPSQYIHTSERGALTASVPGGPYVHQNAPPYTHNDALVAPATGEATGAQFIYSGYARDSQGLNFAQGGPHGGFDQPVQPSYSEFFPPAGPTSSTTPHTVRPPLSYLIERLLI